MLSAFQAQWLIHHGAVVTIDGHKHRLAVTSYEAIYPYAHTVLNVSAECLEQDTAYYQDIKTVLGDNWSTDILHGSAELTTSVMQQLGWQWEESTP
jgi:hypothetical protein